MKLFRIAFLLAALPIFAQFTQGPIGLNPPPGIWAGLTTAHPWPFSSPFLAAAQTIADMSSLAQSLTVSQSTALNLCASQGDGTCLTLMKLQTPKLNATLKVASPGIVPQTAMVFSGGASASMWLQLVGDVSCFLGVNPTAAAVSWGGFGPTPASSISWQCTTNIRASGVVTGQTAIVSGSVTWP